MLLQILGEGSRQSVQGSSVSDEDQEMGEGDEGYAKGLAILELLTRPLRETFERGEMTGCQDNDPVTFFQTRDVAADTFDDPCAFERRGGISSLDFARVDEDVLRADTHD